MHRGFDSLLSELAHAGAKTGHVSFSRDFGKASEEAREACALANTAALDGEPCGYRVWGISPRKRHVVGTDFDPEAPYKQGLSYAEWLSGAVGGRILAEFLKGDVGARRVVIMRVFLKGGKPARFKKQYWIRIAGITTSVDPKSDGGRSVKRALQNSLPTLESLVAGNEAEAVAEQGFQPEQAEEPASPMRKAFGETAPDSWANDLEFLLAYAAENHSGDGGDAAEKAAPAARASSPESQEPEQGMPESAAGGGSETVRVRASAPRNETHQSGWLGPATDELEATYALNLLDWESLLRAHSLPIPDQTDGVVDMLRRMSLLTMNGPSVTITNLGALAIARDLRMFDTLDRLAIQVVIFRGTGRAEAIATQRFDTGYATAIEAACNWIRSVHAQSVGNEISPFPYPATVLREVIANATAHQSVDLDDALFGGSTGGASLEAQFGTSGFPQATAGPLVEVFANRIEVSNSGSLSVSLAHIADESLRDEGNLMAQTLRQFRPRPTPRSGWSSILESCDMHHAPVPVFTSNEGSELTLLEFARRTDVGINQLSLNDLVEGSVPVERSAATQGWPGGPQSDVGSETASLAHKEGRVCVTLRPITPFKAMSPEQRLIATYWHAFNMHAHDGFLTNSSLRERFDVEYSNSAQISRLIKDASQHGLIRVTDPNAAPKFKRYVPYWA